MAQITAPKAGDDSRELWKVVAEVVKRLNALDNLKINPRGRQNKLTLAEGNATLELDGLGLQLVSVEWCEGGVQGTRAALLGEFKPNA